MDSFGIWKCLFCLHFWRSSAGQNSRLTVFFFEYSRISFNFWFPWSWVRSWLLIILMLPCMWWALFLLLLLRFSVSLACNNLAIMCLDIDYFVFLLLEVCWASWMSENPPHICFWPLFLQIVFVLPQPGLQPWANRAIVLPHLPIFKIVTSTSKATDPGLLSRTLLNWMSPFSLLQRRSWSSQPIPARQKFPSSRTGKRAWQEPQAECHWFSLLLPKVQQFLKHKHFSDYCMPLVNFHSAEMIDIFGLILSCFIVGGGFENHSSLNHCWKLPFSFDLFWK